MSDVYDALRSERCYKFGLQHEDVLSIMREENGIRFDPEIFNAFEKSLPEFIAIHEKYSH